MSAPAVERPIAPVRGTRDRFPTDQARLAGLEALLLDRFARAGYDRLDTPILEPIELHERRSGAGIVSKLIEVAGAEGEGGVCLRPELTAGVVRAYTAVEPAPAPPWRVSHAGLVFRRAGAARPREFRQVGVERLGDGGAPADAEVVWLADWSLAEAGVRGVTIRIGHVGLILEMLRRSGLPAPLGAALVDRLSEAAAEGQGVHALSTALEQLGGWLHPSEAPAEAGQSDTAAIDRLFRTLVPVVTGRRGGDEIVGRLRRKWDLGHGLHEALGQVGRRIGALAELKGGPADVLDRLGSDVEALAPDSVAELRALLQALEHHGVDPSRLMLDLGLARGIGFYSRTIFDIVATGPDGRVEELGGGGRYDGLARVLGSDRDDRGAGFDFALDRVAAALEAQGRRPEPPTPGGFVVVAVEPDAEAEAEAIDFAHQLRTARGARAVAQPGMPLETALRFAAERRYAGVCVLTRGRDRADFQVEYHDIASGTSRTLARDPLEAP